MLLKIIGLLIFMILIITASYFQESIAEFLSAIELQILGITAGGLLLMTFFPLVEWQWGRELKVAWRKRFEKKMEGARTTAPPQMIKNIFRFLNGLLLPVYSKGPGRILLVIWQDAGFGSQPLPFSVLLIGIIAFGSLGGYFVTGSGLLSGFFTLLFVGGFIALLCSRAKTHRQLFQNQFPGVLDRLADSLQAGFSLPQAIEFFAPKLSEPSASEMTCVFTQMQVGFSIEQALESLYQRHSNEDVRLFVEGIKIQRLVGGNMVEMIREISVFIRQRVELENEIRTMTAQGRLSAVVIASLVPVSIALLSLFPGYTDVLFRSTIGNLVLIAAGLFELIGAWIVIRLIRIEV